VKSTVGKGSTFWFDLNSISPDNTSQQNLGGVKSMNAVQLS